MEYIKQEELDYLVEFVENEETNDWNKAKVDLKSEYHCDTIRKSFGVGKFSGYSVYKFMQDKIEQGFLTDEEAIRLEKLREKEYIEMKLDEREPKPFKGCSYKIKNGNESSLLISDLHCGATVDSIFNYYDLDVLKERMEELASKTIAFCKRDNVDLLHANFLGDFITGIIHGSTIAQAQEDVIDQILDASDIIVEFIKELRKEIALIKTDGGQNG